MRALLAPRVPFTVILLACLLSACDNDSAGFVEPERVEVKVEGFVTSVEDGSPIEGASVRATRRVAYNCDEVFCSYRTETWDSAETDSEGYFRLILPRRCFDFVINSVSEPSYITEMREVCVPDGGQRIDIQMHLTEPTIIVSGTVRPAGDTGFIPGVRVTVYDDNSDEPIGSDVTDYLGRGGYRISLACNESVYVQATCRESTFPLTHCAGWRDSESVRLQSECRGPGTLPVEHRIDFVLQPLPE